MNEEGIGISVRAGHDRIKPGIVCVVPEAFDGPSHLLFRKRQLLTAEHRRSLKISSQMPSIAEEPSAMDVYAHFVCRALKGVRDSSGARRATMIKIECHSAV
jgi:hypothetical protein